MLRKLPGECLVRFLASARSPSESCEHRLASGVLGESSKEPGNTGGPHIARRWTQILGSSPKELSSRRRYHGSSQNNVGQDTVWEEGPLVG